MKKTHFNLHLLNDPNYSNWLVATGDSSSVKCKLCNRTFTLSNMSKGACIREPQEWQKTPRARVSTDSS